MEIVEVAQEITKVHVFIFIIGIIIGAIFS